MSTKKDPKQQEMVDIITKYDHLFQGIGRFKDKKNNKEIYGQFYMEPEAIAVTHEPRPVPHHFAKTTKGVAATKNRRGHFLRSL